MTGPGNAEPGQHTGNEAKSPARGNGSSPQRDAAGLSGDDERRARAKIAAGDEPDTDALGHQDGAS